MSKNKAGIHLHYHLTEQQRCRPCLSQGLSFLLGFLSLPVADQPREVGERVEPNTLDLAPGIPLPSFFVLGFPEPGRVTEGTFFLLCRPWPHSLSQSLLGAGRIPPSSAQNHHEGKDDGCRGRLDYPEQTQAGKLDGCEEVDPAQGHMPQEQEVWLVLCWHQ